MDKAPDAFRTISEVADDLDVPQHVLRFWETRFPQIRPMKRGGGRRYYRPEDVDLLRGIRHLLYGEGYTIRGVQRLLKDNGTKFVQGVWRGEAAVLPPPPAAEEEDEAAEAEAAAPAPELMASAAVARPAVRHFSRANVVAEPVAADPPEPVPAEQPPEPVHEEAAPEPPPAELSAENRRRLQAALYELGECRRLLEAALKEE